MRASLATWSWAPDAPGPVAIFVRAPSETDVAIPTRAEPHAEAYLELKKQVQPAHPGGSPARCTVRFALEANGVPLLALVSGCPANYFTAVGDAVMRWRWYPPRTAEGKPTRARTEVGIVFDLR